MIRQVALASGIVLAGSALPSTSASIHGDIEARSPLYDVTVPDGCRRSNLVGVAHETAPLNELRAVLGNLVAIATFAANRLPFQDGTVLVKLAWQHVRSGEFPPVFVPGKATTLQVVVKDSRRYAAMAGWGFGRFIDGIPADEAQHRTCFGCHAANVMDHDYVFTP